MADRTLLNYAAMEGVYGVVPFEDERTTQVSVLLTDIPFTKTADKTVWLNGELTYTLEVDNTLGEDALSNVVITDQLDRTMFAIVANSLIVAIDDVPLVLGTDYTVVYTTTGLLTVTFVAAIEAGAKATISFRGTKVPA